MSAVTLVAEALLLALLGFTLRELGFRGVPLFGLFSALLLLSHGVEALRTLLPAFVVFWDTGLSDSLSAALKITGIGYLSSVTADVCRDLGEAAIGRAVVFSARMEILLIALPFIKTIVETAVSLLI